MRNISNLAVVGCAAVAAALAALLAGDDVFSQTAKKRLPPPPGFVSTSGTRFTVDGKVFPVAGVNNHYLVYGTQEEVVRVLDDAVAMGANVVRTFLQPVIGSKTDPNVPTIWDFRSRAETSNLGVNGSYLLYWDGERDVMAVNDGPNGLQKIDFLMAEAAKRNLKVIVALLDYWRYTGGAAQMSAWYGNSDPARFFPTDPRTVRDYKSWAQTVITRKNSITGTIYADDPAIFGWQLMNEPNFEPTSVLYDWVSEMSAYIKSIDPHHLVSVGHGNIYDQFSDLEIETIDFGTWHGYPVHWGISPQEMNARIGDFCAIAKKYSKPMLLEEFGYARRNLDQIDVYKTWLDTIYRNRDCAGWVVWRLVSRQKAGIFPQDRHDQFDIRNDGGALFETLRQAAGALRLGPMSESPLE